MRKLDELIVLDEYFLGKLNRAIGKTVQEKEEFDIDYDLLEKVLEAEIKNKRFRRTGPINKVVPIKKEELLAVALNFFESIDDEFYGKARDVILGQLKRIKMNMYLLHDMRDFSAKDEHGIREYTRDASVQTDRGFSVVHIPLQERVKSQEANVILKKDEGTLGDLYTIVHEISHLFDLRQADTIPSKEEIAQGRNFAPRKSVTRELLGEATAIAFEGLLTDYLLKKGLYPESAVRDIENTRANNSLADARIVYTKLMLAKQKVRNGNITNEYIEEMMKQNDMSVYDARDLARKIVQDNRKTMYRNRYAVGGLVAPTIIKAYERDKENGTQSLKEYLKAVYDDNFEGALRAIGIEPNAQGINTLAKNMKARDAKINKDKER